jgi:hypothetical protein
VLVSEQILTLSGRVSEITNKAYITAPMLVSDLQGLSTDLRGLYEAVLEIEPSRGELREVERRLRRELRAFSLGRLRWLEAEMVYTKARLECLDDQVGLLDRVFKVGGAD